MLALYQGRARVHLFTFHLRTLSHCGTDTCDIRLQNLGSVQPAIRSGQWRRVWLICSHAGTTGDPRGARDCAGSFRGACTVCSFRLGKLSPARRPVGAKARALGRGTGVFLGNLDVHAAAPAGPKCDAVRRNQSEPGAIFNGDSRGDSAVLRQLVVLGGPARDSAASAERAALHTAGILLTAPVQTRMGDRAAYRRSAFAIRGNNSDHRSVGPLPMRLPRI